MRKTVSPTKRGWSTSQVMMGGHLWVGIWLMKNECAIRSLEKPDNSRVLLKSRYSMSGTIVFSRKTSQNLLSSLGKKILLTRFKFKVASYFNDTNLLSRNE